MWFKALVVGLYVFFSSTVAIPAQANSAKILILGDSISAGYGVPRGYGWVDLLPEALSQPVAIINASISGETAMGGAARIDALLAQHQPDIVVIELGGNDGLRGHPLSSIEQHLASMIATSQAKASCGVVLLGMRIPPNYGPRYSEGFFALYGRLAARYNTKLVEFFLANVADKPDLMQQDGIHPTTDAQPMLVDNAKSILNEMLHSCRR